MPTNMPIQLAQIIAQARPQAMRLGGPGQVLPPTGTTDQGYGPIGQAFGQGAGDFLKNTLVKQAEDTYNLENNPVELEKRAHLSWKMYQDMAPEERANYMATVQTDPKAMKLFSKFQKAAPYLFQKDETTGNMRFSQQPYTKDQLVQQELAAMAKAGGGKLAETLFSKERLEGAQAEHARVTAQEEPKRTAVQERQVGASERQAGAAEREVAAREALVPSAIQLHKAQAIAALRRSPEEAILGRMQLELMKEKRDQVKQLYGSAARLLDDTRKNLAGGKMSKAEAWVQDLGTLVSAGVQIQKVDPRAPESTAVFADAAKRLSMAYDSYLGQYKTLSKKGFGVFGRGIGGLYGWAPSPEIDPVQNGRLAFSVMDAWQPTSSREWDVYISALQELGGRYGDKMFPGPTAVDGVPVALRRALMAAQATRNALRQKEEIELGAMKKGRRK